MTETVSAPWGSDDEPKSVMYALSIAGMGTPFTDYQGTLYGNPRYWPDGTSCAEFKDYGLARAVRVLCNNADAIKAALRTPPQNTDGEAERVTDGAKDDDAVAAAIKFVCAACVEDEREFSCHDASDVRLVGAEVLCKEHAGSSGRSVPDIALKLKRQRGALAAANRRVEKSASALSAMKAERDALHQIIADLFAPDGHQDGCLFKADPRMPCQCDYHERMGRYRKAVDRAKEIAATLQGDAKPTKYVPVCRQFIADPCGSARCAGCGKYRREHPKGDAK